MGTVHQITSEHSLQVVRTMLQSRHTILDITRKGQGTSVSVVFQGPNAPDHVTLGPEWYKVYPSRGRKPKCQVSYNCNQQATIEEPPFALTSRQQSQKEDNIRTWRPTFAAAYPPADAVYLQLTLNQGCPRCAPPATSATALGTRTPQQTNAEKGDHSPSSSSPGFGETGTNRGNHHR